MAGKLSNGVHVKLYDGQEIEVEAVLEFDQEANRWMASPLWNTMRRQGEQRKWPDVAE
jgi:hypothetical protein